MKIALTPCKSSQIHAYGYDAETKTLALQFKRKGDNGQRVGGSVYHYSNVEAQLFADFIAAESKGSFFGVFIKNNTTDYPYTKIDPEAKDEAQGEAA